MELYPKPGRDGGRWAAPNRPGTPETPGAETHCPATRVRVIVAAAMASPTIPSNLRMKMTENIFQHCQATKASLDPSNTSCQAEN